MIPPIARQEMETVTALPIRNEVVESARAVTGIVVVTAVPMPKRVENAYVQLNRWELTRPIKP